MCRLVLIELFLAGSSKKSAIAIVVEMCAFKPGDKDLRGVDRRAANHVTR